MKSIRTTLFHSVIALLLCMSMLVGTTYAWFTDSVSTGINTIAAGNLDVELYHSNAAVTDEAVTGDTKLFMDLQGEPILWEPGVVSYENLRVANEGDLALVYQMAINTANENFVVDGNNLYGLSQILKVGVVEGGITATDREGVVASVEEANWTTLANFLRNGSLLPVDGQNEQTWGIVIWWEPGENDNFWNLNNGKTLNEGEVLSIDLGIQLIATQDSYESDSFGNRYDAEANYFKNIINENVSAPIGANAENGQIVTPMVVGGGESTVQAEIPQGVALADGATELTLSVKTMDNSEANIELNNGESATSVDVHIDGVAENNTVPMLITVNNLFSTGLNQGNYAMYHVENGATVAMTCVDTLAEVDAHNEFFYDVPTGNVTMALASFSEVAAVADLGNPWNGTTVAKYETENGEIVIYNADQLAYFRNQVDNGHTFVGETVKLANDINLNGKNFDPIGWGYVNTAHNSESVAGKPFKGTFNGDGHTIYGLHQNGWELGYSYTNCGGGLFASAEGAIFENLTISGANIVMECNEMGILVGLSQGNCTYKNINIYNSKIANYQRATGGLIGEVSGDGTTYITNVTIGADVVVGSLWGDFDTPVGGVIGARWDDAGKNPQIVMENVTADCRLDVFSDVTAAYQWYAYRRAGMLIGNTDTPPADGKNAKVATAEFLTCVEKADGTNTVKVHISGWNDYHYCRFSNTENNGRNYPWVRVEEGLNNPAYSNPRYGHPTDADGNVVTDANHVHGDEDNSPDYHNASIPFNQLYGGGQGVYGATVHKNKAGVDDDTDVDVVTYIYSITYREGDHIHHVEYVVEDKKITNDEFYKMPGLADDAYQWVNAGSTVVQEIPMGNKNDIVLYLDRADTYVARFLYQDGSLYKAIEFNNQTGILKENEPAVPSVDGLIVVRWESYTLKGAKGDISIKPVYKINDYVQLNPIDTDGDGVTNYYEVVGSNIPSNNTDIVIPEKVNGIEVRSIITGAFADGGLRDVFVPNSIEYIGKNAFCENNDGLWGIGAQTPQIQIIFEGTKGEWEGINKVDGWDDNIGENSVVICRANGVIIGYFIQLNTNSTRGSKWEWHDGAPNGFPRPEWDEDGFPKSN